MVLRPIAQNCCSLSYTIQLSGCCKASGIPWCHTSLPILASGAAPSAVQPLSSCIYWLVSKSLSRALGRHCGSMTPWAFASCCFRRCTSAALPVASVCLLIANSRQACPICCELRLHTGCTPVLLCWSHLRGCGLNECMHHGLWLQVCLYEMIIEAFHLSMNVCSMASGCKPAYMEVVVKFFCLPPNLLPPWLQLIFIWAVIAHL